MRYQPDLLEKNQLKKKQAAVVIVELNSILIKKEKLNIFRSVRWSRYVSVPSQFILAEGKILKH